MKKIILLILIMVFIGSIFAKRTTLPEVQPIQVNNYQYCAKFEKGYFRGKGIIEIYNIETSTKEKEIYIYSFFYNIFIERDVQFVLIIKMERLNNSIIRITNEQGNIYDLDIITEKVEKMY